ncbi:MAG: hypothetical protein WCO21_00465 [bacterium]|nr:hypothetical protein [Candidatus Jorgensenbacteria bacterium]
MEQVKIFESRMRNEIEAQINTWLAENPALEITRRTQSADSNRLVIAIWYKA